MAESSRDGHLVCMVCGGILSASGPAAARKHILQHHAHSLDFNLEEKRNILEGWSEGVVLPEERPLPCPAGKPTCFPVCILLPLGLSSLGPFVFPAPFPLP